MQILTKEEVLEIKGAGWADVGKGSLWSAAIVLTIFIVLQARPCCRRILSGWRNWRRTVRQKSVESKTTLISRGIPQCRCSPYDT
jgi:hypothetical protein